MEIMKKGETNKRGEKEIEKKEKDEQEGKKIEKTREIKRGCKK